MSVPSESRQFPPATELGTQTAQDGLRLPRTNTDTVTLTERAPLGKQKHISNSKISLRLFILHECDTSPGVVRNSKNKNKNLFHRVLGDGEHRLNKPISYSSWIDTQYSDMSARAGRPFDSP